MKSNMPCTFLWFIENYSYCWQKKGEKLVCPTFIAHELAATSWNLWLYPRGKDDKNEGSIFIALHRNKDDGPDSLTVNYRITIVAEDGSNLFTQSYTSDFAKNFGYGWSFVEMDEIHSWRRAEYFPKDILTVRCELWEGIENEDNVALTCARSRIGIEHINFHHVVNGFGALETNQKQIYQIYSPSQNIRVESSVYISDDPCSKEKLMVEIAPFGRGQILSKCELFLLETSGKKSKCAEADNRFHAERKNIGKLPLPLTKGELLNMKRDYLPSDKLSLLCECTFSTGIVFQKNEGAESEMNTMDGILSNDNPHIKCTNISTEKLSACLNALDDMKVIYKSKFLTDVELKTETSSFPAHKMVLCARSPIFKVMMSNDMKEKNSNSIPVSDLDDDTVQQLLLFLYSDNLEDLQWKTATKLYYAADKYQIEKLKLMCSSFLIDNLTISTASELLLLADTHSDSDLKKAVEDFILKHDEEVFGSEKWETLMEANPQLALKTFHLKYKTK